jgi:hypothetical protein
VVLGFQDGVPSLHFSLMPATKRLVMTIQGSSPVAATTMTTPNTPFLLRSPYFFTSVNSSTIVCHLLILAFIFASVESATSPTRLLVFLFHTSGISNTLLYLFFMGLRFHNSPNHPWKISAIWREVPVVFIDCTGPFPLVCNLGHLH